MKTYTIAYHTQVANPGTPYYARNVAKAVPCKTIPGMFQFKVVSKGSGQYPHIGSIEKFPVRLVGQIGKAMTISEVKKLAKISEKQWENWNKKMPTTNNEITKIVNRYN